MLPPPRKMQPNKGLKGKNSDPWLEQQGKSVALKNKESNCNHEIWTDGKAVFRRRDRRFEPPPPNFLSES